MIPIKGVGLLLLWVPYAFFITLIIKLVMNELPREGRGKAVARRAAAVAGCAAGLVAVICVELVAIYGAPPDSFPIIGAVISGGTANSDSADGTDSPDSSGNVDSLDSSGDVDSQKDSASAVETEPMWEPRERGGDGWIDDYTYVDPVFGWILYDVPEDLSWSYEISEDGQDTTFCLYAATGGDAPVVTLSSCALSGMSSDVYFGPNKTKIYSGQGAYDNWYAVGMEADAAWFLEYPDIASELRFYAPGMEQLFLADILHGQWPTEYWDAEKQYGVTVPEELTWFYCTGLGRYHTKFYLGETALFTLEVYPAGTELSVRPLYEDDSIIVSMFPLFNGGISEEGPAGEGVSQQAWERFYNHMDDILFVTKDGESYSIGAYLKELYPAE